MAAAFVRAENIDGDSFCAFGKVITIGDSPLVINNGYAKKHPALATIESAADGKSRMHLFVPKPRIPPIPITMMERHPKGAQCFVPLGGDDWLALVADNADADTPGALYAFAAADIGLCYHKNTWHFPLLALSGQRFAVCDSGDIDDLQEYYYDDIRWLMHHTKNTHIKTSITNENAFMKVCANIAEESPWVAKAVWQHINNPADDDHAPDMATAFALAILRAEDAQQLQLIRKHPQLATAKLLSMHSASEQTAAGLSNLCAADADNFAKLNGEYGERFGFPFVCAVAGMTAADIIAELTRRTNNNAPNAAVCERGEALYQIFQIIRNRLRELPL